MRTESKHRTRPLLSAIAFVALLCVANSSAVVLAEPSYTQQQDVIFSETDGICLVMDIFRPVANANGMGIVDIASGAWHSDRGKINDHKTAQMFQIMCDRGYTVFAVRPGSVTKFSALEMVSHIKRAIRWVKHRHEEFKIDPDRLGLCGASAGGHLTCLTAVMAEDGRSEASDPLDQHDTRVKACVAFFPPTDFLQWGTMKIDPAKADSRIAKTIGNLLFAGGLNKQTPEEITAAAEKISPARHVTSQMPPLLLIHGDADFVVPLQQSKIMLEAMEKAGVPCELIVKKGGGHPWFTIHEEVKVATDWLDKNLAATP